MKTFIQLFSNESKRKLLLVYSIQEMQ